MQVDNVRSTTGKFSNIQYGMQQIVLDPFQSQITFKTIGDPENSGVYINHTTKDSNINQPKFQQIENNIIVLQTDVKQLQKYHFDNSQTINTNFDLFQMFKFDSTNQLNYLFNLTAETKYLLNSHLNEPFDHSVSQRLNLLEVQKVDMELFIEMKNLVQYLQQQQITSNVKIEMKLDVEQFLNFSVKQTDDISKINTQITTLKSDDYMVQAKCNLLQQTKCDRDDFMHQQDQVYLLITQNERQDQNITEITTDIEELQSKVSGVSDANWIVTGVEFLVYQGQLIGLEIVASGHTAAIAANTAAIGVLQAEVIALKGVDLVGDVVPNIVQQVNQTFMQKVGDWVKENWMSLLTGFFGTGVGSDSLVKVNRLFEVLTIDKITSGATDPAENGLYYIEISQNIKMPTHDIQCQSIRGAIGQIDNYDSQFNLTLARFDNIIDLLYIIIGVERPINPLPQSTFQGKQSAMTDDFQFLKDNFLFSFQSLQDQILQNQMQIFSLQKNNFEQIDLTYLNDSLNNLQNGIVQQLLKNDEITSSIASEIATRTTLQNWVVQIANQANTSTSGIITLTNNLNTEIINRTNSDATLQTNINTLQTSLTSEIINRTNSDATLQANINSVQANLDLETLNRSNIDTTLQDNINTVQGNLTVETSNRVSVTNTLTTNLNKEITDRTNACATLTTNLNKEIADRITLLNWTQMIAVQANTSTTNCTNLQTSVNNLNTNLNAQTTARINGDNTLTTNLNTEITNRTNGDSTLTTNLNSEITNRTNADTSLQSQITALQTTVANLQSQITSQNNSLIATIKQVCQMKIGQIISQSSDQGASFTIYGNVMLRCDGQSFNPAIYTQLAAIFTDGYVPNLNGCVLRQNLASVKTISGANSVTLTIPQLPTHGHQILYNASGAKFSIWGSNSINGGNFGNPTSGTTGLAGTSPSGNGQAIDITNKGFNCVFYIVAQNIW